MQCKTVWSGSGCSGGWNGWWLVATAYLKACAFCERVFSDLGWVSWVILWLLVVSEPFMFCLRLGFTSMHSFFSAMHLPHKILSIIISITLYNHRRGLPDLFLKLHSAKPHEKKLLLQDPRLFTSFRHFENCNAFHSKFRKLYHK